MRRRFLYPCLVLILISISPHKLFALPGDTTKQFISIGIGISTQFFLVSGENETIQGGIVPSNPKMTASGPGLSVFFNASILNNWSIEYAPTFRYDFIKYNDVLIFRDKHREFIMDHNFTIVKKMKKYELGLGYSIISPGKGYETHIMIEANGVSHVLEYLDMEFDAFHISGRFEPFRNLLSELKILYIPSVEYVFTETWSIFPLISVKYRIL